MTVLFETDLNKVLGEKSVPCKVSVCEGTFTWAEKENTSEVQSVRVSWVLKLEQVDEGESNSRLTVHYATRTLNKDFSSDISLAQVTFSGPREHCSQLVQKTEEQVHKKVPNRPKDLLVIINPKSGNGKAVNIFNKDCLPIFKLCGINVDVIVTKKAKHSDEILDQYDLSKVQGVVAVGGDGTLTEVISALLKRTMKDAQIDANDPKTVLKSPHLICSMISGGSANGHPLFAGMSKVPTSSTIMIAIGHDQTMDIFTVHCGQKLMQYGWLLLGYGQMASIMSVMENNRWAGPARYLALPFGLFIKREMVDFEMDYLLADDSKAEESKRPQETAEGASGGLGEGWKTVSGRYHSGDMTMINVSSPGYKKPYSIQSTLNDGKIYLWLTKTCGRMQQVEFFKKLTKCDHTAFDVDFIERYALKEYRIRATGKTKDSKTGVIFNLDGDIFDLPEPHFEVKSHQGLVRIFSRDDAEDLLKADEELSPNL